VLRWHPTRAFDGQVMREVLRYGVNITLVGLIGAFMLNVDYLLVGRILGAVALGYYTMAFRIPELVIRSVGQIIGRVAFPVLARYQAEGKVEGAFFVYLRYMSLFTFPAGVGLAFISAPFVHVFYQDVWIPIIVPMRFVAIASSFSIVSYLSGVIYNSVGRPDMNRRLAFVKLPVVMAVIYAATNWGINGVAGSHVILTFLAMALDLAVMRRVLGVRVGGVFNALSPALISTAVMAAIIAALSFLLVDTGIVALVLLPLVGAVAYLGTLWVVGRDTLLQARSVLWGSFARRRGTVPQPGS
jgi:PST family polysaccharide transporter